MIERCDIKDIGQYVVEGTVDLIIFDPPYGIGDNTLVHKEKNWSKSAEEWDSFESVDEQYDFYLHCLDILLPLLNDTGSLFIFGSFHSIFLTGEILQRRLNAKIINSIVWNKTNAMFSMTRRSLIEGTEYIIWATRKKNKYYFNYEFSRSVNSDRQLRNVWSSGLTPSSELCGHPHQKPLWLIHRLIKLGCPPNGFVVDPMCGSGTTEFICCSEHIQSFCSDINSKYLTIASKRLKQLSQNDMFSRDSALL